MPGVPKHEIRDALDSPAPAGPARHWRIAATALTLLPLLTASLRALRNDWFPIGDSALFAIRAADVGTEHHPFLGAWTSASLSVGTNMNNPGGIYDWFIAPFAHLLSPGAALAVGVATVNAVMVIGISATSHRIGGWPLQRVALVFTALMMWSMGSEMLIDMWQANALILTFMLLLVTAIGIAGGDDALLPVAAVVSTVLLQTHISYAYIFVVLVLAVVVARVQGRADLPATPRPRTSWRHWRRPVLASSGIVAVLWAPTLWEQFFGTGTGNLTRLASNASGGDISLGLTSAARIVSTVGTLAPWWSRGRYSTTAAGSRFEEDGRTLNLTGLAPMWLALLGLVVVTALLLWLIRQCQRRALHLQAAGGTVAVILLVGSIVALSRLTVGTIGLSPHHFRWVWPLAIIIHLVMTWMAISVWAPKVDLDRLLSSGAMVSLAAVSLLNIPFHAQPSGPVADYAAMPTMRHIKPALARLDGHGPVFYDVINVRVFEPYSWTMMMWLHERGTEIRVEDEIAIRHLGENRRSTGDERTRLFQLEGIEARTYRGPACTIGVASLLPPDQDDAVRSGIETLATSLAAETDSEMTEVFDAIVRGEIDAGLERSSFDTWVTSAYAVLATGDVCDEN